MGQFRQGYLQSSSYWTGLLFLPHTLIFSMKIGQGVAVTVLVLLFVENCVPECLWKQTGLTVGEGEAVGFNKKRGKVKICDGGKIKVKNEKLVQFTLACNGCAWYDKVFCDGEVVKDLYIWWFLSRCSGNKMRVVGRSWGEVVKDKRYKAQRDSRGNFL